MRRVRELSFVVDVSVFIDYFVRVKGYEDRHHKARGFIAKISSLGLTLYEPFLFDIELRGVLVRRMESSRVVELVEDILQYVNIVGEEELHDIAAKIALNTGCRAVDSYYIATAVLTSSILVTNDRIMQANSRKSGIEVYYLAGEYDKLMLKLSKSIG